MQPLKAINEVSSNIAIENFVKFRTYFLFSATSIKIKLTVKTNLLSF